MLVIRRANHGEKGDSTMFNVLEAQPGAGASGARPALRYRRLATVHPPALQPAGTWSIPVAYLGRAGDDDANQPGAHKEDVHRTDPRDQETPRN